MSRELERISFWIPREDRWLFQAIENVRIKIEQEMGVSVSQGDIILNLLKPHLQPHAGLEVEPKKVKIVERPCQLKRSIVCSKKNRGILQLIDRIVEVKRLAGFKTSFSNELFRLAKSGVINSLDGAEVDRSILRKDDDTSKGTSK